MSRALHSPASVASSTALLVGLGLSLLGAAAAQDNSTTPAVTITYDPATAKDAATYIVAVSALGYVGFLGVAIASWLRFRVQVLPQINLMKNVEVEHVRCVCAKNK